MKAIITLICLIMISCTSYSISSVVISENLSVGFNALDCREIEQLCYRTGGTYTINREYQSNDWMCRCITMENINE